MPWFWIGTVSHLGFESSACLSSPPPSNPQMFPRAPLFCFKHFEEAKETVSGFSLETLSVRVKQEAPWDLCQNAENDPAGYPVTWGQREDSRQEGLRPIGTLCTKAISNSIPDPECEELLSSFTLVKCDLIELAMERSENNATFCFPTRSMVVMSRGLADEMDFGRPLRPAPDEP